ncbi:MAG TPA: hypothetical protein VHG32_26960 [Thermoanaerobaculia bacterium]|jgi:hypothetical protein|nr:hypothetical protein [Thermoanaerobaculia bacterium]
MDAPPQTLVGALQQLSYSVNVSLDRIAGSIGGIDGEQLEVYKQAVSGLNEKFHEELLLCYTVGNLVFVPFKPKGKPEERYGLLDMALYTLDGKLNGRYQVVWQPNPDVPPAEIFQVPAPEYTEPWDKVVEPIPTFTMRANSNAYYRFDREGGTIFATGPANLLLTPYPDGSQIFQISVCTFVTGGTGVYKGCRGVNTALGSSFVPKGVDVLNLPYKVPVPGVTVSTFRIVREENIGSIPK